MLEEVNVYLIYYEVTLVGDIVNVVLSGEFEDELEHVNLTSHRSLIEPSAENHILSSHRSAL